MKLMGVPTKIAAIGEQIGADINKTTVCGKYYDAGMVTMLKLVATKVLHDPLDSDKESIEWSQKTTKANDRMNDLYAVLSEKLPADLKPLLQDFDEAYSTKSAYESEDAFISGFIAGFRYLMGEVACSDELNFYK
ncbi:DUF6809 family protein [Bacillus atrophaeus]|uniref:DUF6809 family protein n=1 Tax=Bacillus atrophaeus TaxID=1452 RepID=UPI00123C047A|nr:DUF6809 family protein [Bacillus atrophaeus]KAA6455264.1 hypothetical protein DX926_04325 [Bacillus atrophaeus]MEC2307804.1 hypothetical protein [Bacillus atrophaeus]